MKNFLAKKRIVEKQAIWYTIPLVILLIAIIAFGIFAVVNKDINQGVNIGIDFTGGTMVTVELGEEETTKNYNENLKKITDVINANGAQVSYAQKTGDGVTAAIVVRYGLQKTEVNEKIESELVEVFKDKSADKNIILLKSIGATASSDLIWTSVLAVALSTLLILIYIIFRFRKWFTGFAAVLALLHDVFIVFALTVIFHIQINTSFIAAIITIIAYSINNTIVLFDRVRDNYKLWDETKAVNHNAIVNKSIAQTVMRSINTTITTLFAIVILAIIGVSSIKEFALPVIFGLLAGTFSSIFFAPSLYCAMMNGKEKGKLKKNKKTTEKQIKA